MNYRPYKELEQECSDACEGAVEECKLLGYQPTGWMVTARSLGADEAARRLLIDGELQTGFERLVREGRPDLTIE